MKIFEYVSVFSNFDFFAYLYIYGINIYNSKKFIYDIIYYTIHKYRQVNGIYTYNTKSSNLQFMDSLSLFFITNLSVSKLYPFKGSDPDPFVLIRIRNTDPIYALTR